MNQHQIEAAYLAFGGDDFGHYFLDFQLLASFWVSQVPSNLLRLV